MKRRKNAILSSLRANHSRKEASTLPSWWRKGRKLLYSLKDNREGRQSLFTREKRKSTPLEERKGVKKGTLVPSIMGGIILLYEGTPLVVIEKGREKKKTRSPQCCPRPKNRRNRPYPEAISLGRRKELPQ